MFYAFWKNFSPENLENALYFTISNNWLDLFKETIVNVERSILELNFSEAFEVAIEQKARAMIDILLSLENISYRINYPDNKEGTPLYYAVYYKDIITITQLLKMGADPNVIVNNQRLISMAIEHGTFEIIKLLIEDETMITDVNWIDNTGTNILDLAIKKNDIILLKYLIKNNVDPNRYYFYDNFYDLDLIERYYEMPIEMFEVISKHLEKYLFKEYFEKPQKPEILYPTRRKINNISKRLEILIGLGLDINKKGKDGRTAIYQAINQHDHVLLEALIENQANLYLKYKGKPIIIWAVDNSNSYAVKLLLQAGADAYAIDEEGNNAMQFAHISNSRDFVKLLYENGVHLYEKERNTFYFYNKLMPQQSSMELINCLRKTTEKGKYVDERDIKNLRNNHPSYHFKYKYY